MNGTFRALYGFIITPAIAVAATIGCSSSDSGGSSPGSGASACETLSGKCGDPCTPATETVDCPVGTFCGSDGICIAQCVRGEVPCPSGSSCGTDGRCVDTSGNAGAGGTGSGATGSGATSSGGSSGSNSTGGTGTSGAGGTGTSGAGGTGTSGTGGIAGTGATGPTGGMTVDPNSACAVGAEAAHLKPVNMLIMFDRSGSMNDNDKWPQAAAALNAFFQDSGSAGLRVALRFFPDNLPVSGCTDTDCSASACSQPLVPLGELTADAAPVDMQEAALVSAVDMAFPDARDTGFGTPMYAALDGAEQWAAATQASHPDENTVVVLVTDGSPNGCNENITDIAQLAADTLASNGVLTYAVGIEGSNASDMDAIAQAGGTNAGIFIGAGNAEADLLAALDSIRGQSLSCDFAMPQGTVDNPVDPARINVNYTPGGGTTVLIGQTSSASACSTGGWYYDNATAPTRIFLCPNTCAVVQSDPNASLQIVLGCVTVSIM